MLRKEFIDALTSTGSIPLKELRPYLTNSDPEDITEFQLTNNQFFNELKFAQLCSQKFKIPFIDLKNAKVTKETLSTIPKKAIVKYRLLPIQKTANKITFATFDPTVVTYAGTLAEQLKKPVEVILTTISAFQRIFSESEQSIDELVATVMEMKGDTGADDNVSEKDIGDDVITFVNRILAESFVKKASDIHVEPYEKSFRIRLRLDGNLVEIARPPKSMQAPIVSRLKILAKLDISEKRKPQDGRIKLSVGGKPIDYRVSSLPTLFGEKVVMRLLDQSNLQLDMTKLGFEKEQIEALQAGILKPYGMCLVTGPTGSGKTTTLYSALAELNKPDTNISTAEDPVEFNLEGINQVNVKKDVGLTFAAALKSFLRQDPDVIMVGEIRDFEVGEIAVEAALTGHLVLSTLHTNDAPSTVTRLLNMGIEPFLVVAALNVVVAQRLCRKICLNCREVANVSQAELLAAGFAPATAEKIKVYKGKGCDKCNKTGYKGRVAIYEVLSVTPGVREAILKHASSDELKLIAIKEGMKTLRMCALTKVVQGLTTLEEAVTNSASDDILQKQKKAG
ncbi:MAG: Flp pilus assembly complex ATPase component TadA [Bacteriovoracaceae bacterium]|nr:Flp pilus assembly complex ATPase component TadA [Bacteriovoracaceae bacterium]